MPVEIQSLFFRISSYHEFLVEAELPLTGIASSCQEGPAAPRMGSGNMFDRIAFAYDSANKWMLGGLFFLAISLYFQFFVHSLHGF